MNKAFDINNLTTVAKSQPDTDSSSLGFEDGSLAALLTSVYY